MCPELSDHDLLARVTAAAERTLAASSARLRIQTEWSFDAPTQMDLDYGWRVRLLFGVGKITWRALKLLVKLTTKDSSFTHQDAEGIVEPAARRYMVDFGAYAELYADGELFGGRSGRSLNTLDPWPLSAKQPDVLWMIAVMLGTVEATVEATVGERVDVRGTLCTEVTIRADLERASTMTDFALHVPAVSSFEELHRLSLTVWIDDQHVRRARHHPNERSTRTIELWDYGTDVSDLDWTRLPNFRGKG